jgi:hypothetical protein
MNMLVKEAFRTLNRPDQKRTSPHHIIVEKLKAQDKNEC